MIGGPVNKSLRLTDNEDMSTREPKLWNRDKSIKWDMNLPYN